MLRKALVLICVGTLVVFAAVAAFAQVNTKSSSSLSASISLALGPLFPTAMPFDARGFLATSKNYGSYRELQKEAQALESQGKLPSAALTYFRAADAALAVGNENEHAKLFGEHGRVLLRIGDVRSADWALKVAAERLEATGQLDALANVWVVQGNAIKAGGNYAASTVLIQKALAWFQQNGNKNGEARALAAECDLLQLQRKLVEAHGKCLAALALQPIGHVDRPRTEKTLGLVYFFINDFQKAIATHMNAMKGFVALGREQDAAWLREMLIDDQAGLLELAGLSAGQHDVYTPLTHELRQLAEKLEAAPEVVWWRVSDCRLRLADLLRKQKKFDEAEEAWKQALAAFERRPVGFQEVPDYATLFEFQGLLARDRGDAVGAHASLSLALAVLEGIVGHDNLDVEMLRDEVKAWSVSETEIEA